jgi:60 kDa SS-A/Ro ribonucleoprotein
VLPSRIPNLTLADPNDAGMLDVVGFDSGAPNLIAEFIRS